MKKFKILLGLLVFVLTLSFLEIRVNAINEPMILNINETRPFSDDDGDGTVGNDKYTIFSNPAQTIFKIGERLETSEELQYLKSLYCLRFGLGFGAENTDIQNLQDITYNKLGNLKTNVDEIIEYYTNTVGYNNIDTEYTYIDTDNEEYLFTPYNCILWLADNIALINENIQITDSEIVDLLTNAGIFPLPQNNTLKLTLDDIDVIQQCAFWTFSNYAGFITEDQAIDNLLKINTSNLDEIDTTRQRGKQVKKLYDYLVTSAKKGAASYGTGNVRPINGEVNLPGVELETTLSATVFEKSFEYNGISNSYYVVGPFKLNITNPNDSWNIDVVPTFGYKSTITATEYTIINRAMLITINNEVVTNFNYDIKDGEQFYVAINKDSMDGATIVEFKLSIDYTYSRIDRVATLWTAEPSDQPVLLVEDEVIDGNGNTETVVENRKPDFALRKYITKIERDGEEVTIASRVPVPDTSTLITGESTTAIYKHSKKPVEVKTGDIVTYTIAVYNEGQIEGKVTEIIDYLPDRIEFVPEKNPDFVAVRDGDDIQNLSEDDIQEILQEAETTKKYLYQILDNKLIIRYLEEYTLNPITADTNKLDSKEINIVCKVIAIEQDADEQDADLVLTNMAEISEYEVEGDIEDRDSEPNYNPAILTDLANYWGTNIIQGETESENYYVGQQDDDDFEKVVIKGANFDLALRKFISSIKRNGEEILDEDRSPEVDISTLTTTTTASYTHPKDAVTVKTGDIVTYTLRVYNEGELDGYVNTITEHIPEGLEFILDSDVNTTYMWTFENVLNINIINTNYWSKARTDNGEVEGLLKGYDGGRDLDYRDVKIEFKVIAPNTYENEIVNIAEISNSVAVNENNQILNNSDRDNLRPVNIENYILKPAPENSTYQEDDDDYERLQVRYFDLALRKFITAVNETEVTSRIPEVVLNEETGDLEYIHDKTPVEVVNADLVTYTIRVYNEGSIAGYAEEIVDDIPAGLVYIPTNTVNKSYRWKMLDSQGNETENVEEAVRLTTDYLSEAYGNTLMSDEDNINPNLINPFDSNLPISNIEPFNPDYRDVKLVFQVDDSAVPVENEDRIIINHAQIAEDSDDDEDSTPGEWIDGEDDQDVESIYVKTFDLSLQKWVTKTIVTIDGVTTTTETGFKPNVGLTEQEGRPNNENEPLAQVVIDKKKINKTEVKFVYSIRVANEGDIAGYATEITDYIPEGLKFVQEDNPIWEKVGETKIVTHALETTLLNPGESKEIEVIFTWINDENNLGVKTNIAAITADYNEYGDAADIDSTPGDIDITQYDHEQEDDDDYALVILTVKTGGGNSYIAIGLVVIAIIATGIVLIKRYVL